MASDPSATGQTAEPPGPTAPPKDLRYVVNDDSDNAPDTIVTRRHEGSYRLSSEASAAVDAATRDFSFKLEARARFIANKHEVVLVDDVRSAETDLLASGIATLITQLIGWLRPIAFLFFGLALPGFNQLMAGQGGDGWLVLWVALATGAGASALTLDIQSSNIKRLWRRIRR